MGEPIAVTFSPPGVTVWVDAGATLLDAARVAGVNVAAPCAGRGICGGCGVRVHAGELCAPDEVELQGLRRAPDGVRLACRARVCKAVTVRPLQAVDVGSEVPVGSGTTGSCAPCIAAVDLGTTTVAAVVIDADSRVELGRSVVANRQGAWGADVISRVAAARDGAGDQIRVAAEGSVRDALVAACVGAGECLGAIERLVVAGNTAMSALLLGADVTSLAAHPFAPPYSKAAPLPPGSALAGELARGATTVVLPPLGGFVGGDALAGLMAAGLSRRGERGLFLDIGTNAEIVLAMGEELAVASAAAGPAFEASGIASGGNASEGAIEAVTVTAGGELLAQVIGGGPARWLCGSGLVSLIATLRSLGHIVPDGRMCGEGRLRDRFASVDGIDTFLVAGGEGVGGDAVVLSQNDVRAFQLAKGAVRAAIEEVLAQVGPAALPWCDEVVVAGSFGGALSPDDLCALGVLPVSFARHVRIAGNTSLTGAAMVAVDAALEDETAETIARVRHIDLAAQAGFPARFLGALALEPYDIGAGQSEGQ
jgi:uncharacterized 2Fe-2S/4Fe-4S cluster protein (DUF4445 family)